MYVKNVGSQNVRYISVVNENTYYIRDVQRSKNIFREVPFWQSLTSEKSHKSHNNFVLRRLPQSLTNRVLRHQDIES